MDIEAAGGVATRKRTALKKVVKEFAVDIYITLALVTLFAYVSFTFISPFISVLLWGAIFAVTVYPLFLRLTGWFGGREKSASLLIAVLSLTFFLVPMVFIAISATESATNFAEDLRNGAIDIPAPRDSIKTWPVIGDKAFRIWSSAHSDLKVTLQQYLPQIKSAAAKVVIIGTSILSSVLQFAFSIIFASIFLIYTKPLSETMDAVARRLDADADTDFVKMAVSTIRNVFKGIIGIAILQGGLASIGFFVVGLPFAGLWAAAVIALSILQVPALVILPSIIYVWSVKSTVAALIYTVFIVPVMLSDNVLKPILMTKGLSTPMIIIFLGVIGGTLSLGALGLFIGPVVLAVFHEMVRLWAKKSRPESCHKSP